MNHLTWFVVVFFLWYSIAFFCFFVFTIVRVSQPLVTLVHWTGLICCACAIFGWRIVVLFSSKCYFRLLIFVFGRIRLAYVVLFINNHNSVVCYAITILCVMQLLLWWSAMNVTTPCIPIAIKIQLLIRFFFFFFFGVYMHVSCHIACNFNN